MLTYACFTGTNVKVLTLRAASQDLSRALQRIQHSCERIFSAGAKAKREEAAGIGVQSGGGKSRSSGGEWQGGADRGADGGVRRIEIDAALTRYVLNLLALLVQKYKY
jgi:hypothetical protein